jgi:hypothetical protein
MRLLSTIVHLTGSEIIGKFIAAAGEMNIGGCGMMIAANPIASSRTLPHTLCGRWQRRPDVPEIFPRLKPRLNGNSSLRPLQINFEMDYS